MSQRKRSHEPELRDWLDWMFKTAAGAFCTIMIYFGSQGIGIVRDMQAHQVVQDTQIAAIQVDRNNNGPRFTAMEKAFQDFRVEIEGIKVNLQDIQKILEKHR